MKSRLYRMKSMWRNWGHSALVFITFIFVGVASFTFGSLQSIGIAQEPLTVHIPENSVILCADECTGVGKEEKIQPSTQNGEECLFVGSKNGTKYYPPNCSAVSRISPENLICFASTDDAIKKGYDRTKSCPTL